MAMHVRSSSDYSQNRMHRFGIPGVSWAIERSEKDPKQLPIHRISRIATPVLRLFYTRLRTGTVW